MKKVGVCRYCCEVEGQARKKKEKKEKKEGEEDEGYSTSDLLYRIWKPNLILFGFGMEIWKNEELV